MARVGYARVSSIGQSLEVQLDKLKDCDKVFSEKRSGLDSSRPELKACLDYLRDGDTFVISRLDRLARSTLHLHQIADGLKRKNVNMVVLDQSIDTSTPHGKLLFDVLASIAEFETGIRKERQMDGIAKAKEKKVQFGPPRKIEEVGKADIRRKRAEGVLIKDLMAEYKLSKAHIYRILGHAQNDQDSAGDNDLSGGSRT